MNKYSFIKWKKYFSLDGLQIYLVYISFRNYVVFDADYNDNPWKSIGLSYNLDEWSKDLNTDFTLGNRLSGAVKLTKNANPDKYKYIGYSIRFDSRTQFSWADGNNGKNAIILELTIVLLCIFVIEIKIF